MLLLLYRLWLTRLLHRTADLLGRIDEGGLVRSGSHWPPGHLPWHPRHHARLGALEPVVCLQLGIELPHGAVLGQPAHGGPGLRIEVLHHPCHGRVVHIPRHRWWSRVVLMIERRVEGGWVARIHGLPVALAHRDWGLPHRRVQSAHSLARGRLWRSVLVCHGPCLALHDLAGNGPHSGLSLDLRACGVHLDLRHAEWLLHLGGPWRLVRSRLGTGRGPWWKASHRTRGRIAPRSGASRHHHLPGLLRKYADLLLVSDRLDVWGEHLAIRHGLLLGQGAHESRVHLALELCLWHRAWGKSSLALRHQVPLLRPRLQLV